MKFWTYLFLVLSIAGAHLDSLAQDERLYELRTYYTNEGKLDSLHERFKNHTLALFEKHGMTNVGYWVPSENSEQILVYLLSYPDRKTRDKSWQGFLADKDWKAAYKASTTEGKLVKKIESLFLKQTDFSPPTVIEKAEKPRLFEMRDYTTMDGKLVDLHNRFRDHTMELFATHGMTNLPYFSLLPDQEGASNRLVYFLAHKDEDTRAASFDGFRKDPKWTQARKSSEENGKILIKNGVKSLILTPTDYSPLK